MSQTTVEPHEFKPINRLFDRGKKGRCKACFRGRQDHPTVRWIAARPIGDKRESWMPYPR